MIEVRVYDVIANESHKWWFCWGEDEQVFSLVTVKNLFEKFPDEKDFKFNINCPGGEVSEGFAIYDAIRTSGRNIYTNIEGICHSMAVTLLLAAPSENRSANPNCSALIHKVRGGCYAETADELEREAKVTRSLQNQMLDIYADRTGKDRDELEAIMNAEETHSAQELLDWGFISSINSYNTNVVARKDNILFNKNLSMKQKKNIKARATEFVNSVLGVLGVTATNYEFVDENGDLLFSTEAEDDTLEVGMTATPDGEFTLTDGRVVIIADGVITEIKEVEETTTEEEVTNEDLATLKSENENLKKTLQEAVDLIKEMKTNIKSEFTPKGRSNTTIQSTKTLSKEERKAQLKENVKNGSKK